MKYIKCQNCNKKNQLSTKKCISCKHPLVENDKMFSNSFFIKLIIFMIVVLVIGNIAFFFYFNYYIHRVTKDELSEALSKEATGKLQDFDCKRKKNDGDNKIYSCTYDSLSSNFSFTDSRFKSSKKEGTATLSCSKEKVEDEDRCIVTESFEEDVDFTAEDFEEK